MYSNKVRTRLASRKKFEIPSTTKKKIRRVPEEGELYEVNSETERVSSRIVFAVGLYTCCRVVRDEFL